MDKSVTIQTAQHSGWNVQNSHNPPSFRGGPLQESTAYTGHNGTPWQQQPSNVLQSRDRFQGGLCEALANSRYARGKNQQKHLESPRLNPIPTMASDYYCSNQRDAAAPQSLGEICSWSSSTLKWPSQDHTEVWTHPSLTAYWVDAVERDHTRKSCVVTMSDILWRNGIGLLILLSAKRSSVLSIRDSAAAHLLISNELFGTSEKDVHAPHSLPNCGCIRVAAF